MQVHSREVSLSNELLEGEELVWFGCPNEGGKSLVSPTRSMWIIGLVYAIIGLIVILIGAMFSLMPSFTDFAALPAFIGIFAFGSIFFLLGAFFLVVGRIGRSASNTSFYAITDRRVIILRSGRYLRVTSYDARAITQVQRLERPDGSGDLIFSSGPSPLVGTYNTNMYTAMYTANRQGVFNAIPGVRLAEQKLLGIIGKVS